MSALGHERVVIVGAGALGSVYGGMLALAGFDVQLLAREAHARAIGEQGGLQIEHRDSEHGEEVLLAPVRAEWRPERIEPAEIVVLLTKTVDSAVALEPLAHVVSEVRIAVSLQNGVAKDGELAAWCGAERVAGAMSVVGGTFLEPGRVRFTLPGPTFFGELPGGTSERVQRLGEVFRAAGFEVVVTDRILSVEWSKMIHAVPVMSLAALTRLPYHRLLLDPDLSTLFVRLIREGTAVALAAGVDLDDWPMLMPLRTMAGMGDDEALAFVQSFGRGLEEKGMTQVIVSMLQSVESGRRLEVEAVQGHVAREAERLGVAAPTVDACYRLLRGIDASFA
ncbi:MAG: ketopantoate reductase family protein [Actinobacteria bacterium]|nr:ketopantoate reductase family protein [Actinomycetota bacterium]